MRNSNQNLLRFEIWDLRFEIWDLGFGIWDLGFWDFGILGFWDFGILGFWDFGILGFWDLGFGIWDLGLAFLGSFLAFSGSFSPQWRVFILSIQGDIEKNCPKKCENKPKITNFRGGQTIFLATSIQLNECDINSFKYTIPLHYGECRKKQFRINLPGLAGLWTLCKPAVRPIKYWSQYVCLSPDLVLQWVVLCGAIIMER